MVISKHAHDIRVATVAAEVTGSAHGVTHLFNTIVSLAEGGVIVHVRHRVPGQGAVTISDVIHMDWLWRTWD